MTGVDERDTDFLDILAVMAEQTRRELETVPIERRDTFILRESAIRLIKMLDVGAPDFILAKMEQTLMNRLRKRTKERRRLVEAGY